MAGRKVYWEKSLLRGEELPWKEWSPSSSAPKSGEIFFGRLQGTNRAVAVAWDSACERWCQQPHGPYVEISQWRSFDDFGRAQQCVWQRDPS